MTDNVFEDLAEWWLSECASSKNVPVEKAMGAAFRYLGIQNDDEVILSKRIIEEWHQDSEETYISIGEIDFEGPLRTRTLKVAAYAIVTPPGISIDDRLNLWDLQASKLKSAGIYIPRWYLTWRGTIYMHFPHHDMVDYITNHQLDYLEMEELAGDLRAILKGLASLHLLPLGLPYRLRTDGLQIFFCGMGFDVGESIDSDSNDLIQQYEAQILPFLPEKFIEIYKNIH